MIELLSSPNWLINLQNNMNHKKLLYTHKNQTTMSHIKQFCLHLNYTMFLINCDVLSFLCYHSSSKNIYYFHLSLAKRSKKLIAYIKKSFIYLHACSNRHQDVAWWRRQVKNVSQTSTNDREGEPHTRDGNRAKRKC